MPNNLGGNKYKKGKKGGFENNAKQKLELKDPLTPHQYYAKVKKSLGDGRFLVQLVAMCGTKYIGGDSDDTCCYQAVLPGKMKRGKKYWVNVNDYLLVAKRDPSSTTCRIVDIEVKYNSQEVTQLEKMKQVPMNDSIEFSIDDGISSTTFSSSINEGLNSTAKGDKEEEKEDWDATFDEI